VVGCVGFGSPSDGLGWVSKRGAMSTSVLDREPIMGRLRDGNAILPLHRPTDKNTSTFIGYRRLMKSNRLQEMTVSNMRRMLLIYDHKKTACNYVQAGSTGTVRPT